LFEVKGSIKRRLVERRGERREEVCGKERRRRLGDLLLSPALTICSSIDHRNGLVAQPLSFLLFHFACPSCKLDFYQKNEIQGLSGKGSGR
jgi:hypothetical protein